jgi:oligoendopeptidase F
VEDRYGIVARYYQLKARLLGLDRLFDYDRYAALPTQHRRTVGWKEAVEMVVNAYGDFSSRFGRMATEFFERDWVDAPPRPSKQRGAFARATTPDRHPYVLLNFTGQIRDVLMLAHELGHGVHMGLAQRQNLAHMDVPPVLAETASLFCEALTMNRLLEEESNPEARLALLARYIEDLFVAVFRHTAMHKFEDAVHEAIWSSGELGLGDIRKEWLCTQEEMFGGVVTLTETYGSWWSYVPHFFLEAGSSYAYAFGNLVALALYRRYQDAGREFVAPYEEMLAAGSSRSPADLLSSLGIDAEDQAFWQEGLDILEGYVCEAERLAESYRIPLG